MPIKGTQEVIDLGGLPGADIADRILGRNKQPRRTDVVDEVFRRNFFGAPVDPNAKARIEVDLGDFGKNIADLGDRLKIINEGQPKPQFTPRDRQVFQDFRLPTPEELGRRQTPGIQGNVTVINNLERLLNTLDTQLRSKTNDPRLQGVTVNQTNTITVPITQTSSPTQTAQSTGTSVQKGIEDTLKEARRLVEAGFR